MVKYLVEEANARIDILLSSGGFSLLLRLVVKQHFLIICFLLLKNVVQILDECLKLSMGKRHSYLFSVFAVMSSLFVPLFAVVFVYVKLISICVERVS